MFENMVRSAALPAVLEMLNAAHAGLADTQAKMAEFQPSANTFEAAIWKVKTDTYGELAMMVQNIIDEIGKSHAQVQPSQAQPHTQNFNRGG